MHEADRKGPSGDGDRKILSLRRSPLSLIFETFRWAQVAQLVERGPEKAGVGGSTPSLGISKSTT
jgi:hypothetical protein